MLKKLKYTIQNGRNWRCAREKILLIFMGFYGFLRFLKIFLHETMSKNDYISIDYD
jgi:hypothetical protein